MHLTQLFDLSFRGRTDRPALEHQDSQGNEQTLTFGDVDARASRMASELTLRGLARGDRLCVHLANRVEFLDLFLACVRLGVIFVPINILYRERELRHILTDSEPKALVAARDSEQSYPSDVPLWNVEDLTEKADSREATLLDVSLDG